MNNVTLSFDYAGLALKNVRKTQHSEEFAPFRVRVVIGAIKLASWIAPSLSAKLFSGIACVLINLKTTQIARHVAFFDGVAVRMERDIADTAALPDTAELVSKLEEFQVAHLANQKKRQSLVNLLKSRNAQSRVALALERLFRNLDDLCVSAGTLRYVASGESMDVLRQRQLFLNLRSEIRSGTSANFDEEMLALADDAIAASNGRQLSSDAGWPDRMTSGPVH